MQRNMLLLIGIRRKTGIPTKVPVLKAWTQPVLFLRGDWTTRAPTLFID